VLDEDLALTYLAYASIPPEQAFGIARHLVIDTRGGDEGPDYMVSRVTGVHVFHAPGPGEGVRKQMEDSSPLRLGVGGPDGFHIEVLDWSAIGDVVHPQTHKPSLVPSPAPHLPNDPQELLRAHLEIVGLDPAHCYSAQVTEDLPTDIRGRGTAGYFQTTTNVGFKQMCADGKERRRLFGGSQLVVVYRDDPAYAAGRERWARYQREVLQGDLAVGGLRPPVEEPGFTERMPAGVRGLVKTADFLINTADDGFQGFKPHRYCWPPQRGA
jgi:hypothetical protein